MANPTEPPRTKAVRQIPEPGRFWIAHAPRTWRCAGGLWTDLATNQLGGLRSRSEAEPPLLDADGLDDLLYLPPVAKEFQAARARQAASCVEAGTPVLVQLRPGDSAKGLQGAHVVYDLLPFVLKGDVDAFAKLPKGSSAVWPLLPGIGDHPEFWDEALEILAAVGVEVVQPILPELSSIAKRSLAEGRNDEVFDALFHGRPPSEEAFCRVVQSQGLNCFWPRPEGGHTPRVSNNRRIAADLALAGDLWGRLGRSVTVAQALLRAARGAENTSQDLVAVVQEKNLGVITWLDARGREVVTDLVKDGQAHLLEILKAEYLGLPEPPEPERAWLKEGAGE